MKKNIDVIFIANLNHALPRVPSLAQHLSNLGLLVVILTPEIGQKKLDEIKEAYGASFEISEYSCKKDIWNGARKILSNLFRISEVFSRKNSPVDKCQVPRELSSSQIKEKFRMPGIDSIISILMEIYRVVTLSVPDDYKTTIKPGIEHGNRYLRNVKASVIISSSPHPSVHLIAKALTKTFSVPWIAELRDPWVGNHNGRKSLISIFNLYLEKKTLANAKCLVTVTPSFVEILKKRHPHKAVYLLTNGFHNYNSQQSKHHEEGKFTLVYTGAVYTNKQNLRSFFRPLRNFISQTNFTNVEFLFAGKKPDGFDDLVTEYFLEKHVKFYGTVTQKEAYRLQGSANTLVMLAWSDKKQQFIYPTKLFEYMACEAPILVTGGNRDDNVRKIVSKTSSGFYCENDDHVQAALTNIYNDWQKNNKLPKKDVFSYHMANIAKSYKSIILDQL